MKYSFLPELEFHESASGKGGVVDGCLVLRVVDSRVTPNDYLYQSASGKGGVVDGCPVLRVVDSRVTPQKNDFNDYSFAMNTRKNKYRRGTIDTFSSRVTSKPSLHIAVVIRYFQLKFFYTSHRAPLQHS